MTDLHHNQESRETATEYCARCDSYKRKDGTIVEYIDRPGCGDNHDFVKRSTPPPQPANPLPSGAERTEAFTPDDVVLCKHCGFAAWRHANPDHPCKKWEPTPTTPIETDPVNAWMLANGWEWLPEEQQWYRVFPHKGRDFHGTRRQYVWPELAAEMYRMSEVRARDARIEENRLWNLRANSIMSRSIMAVSFLDRIGGLEDNNPGYADYYFKEERDQLAATNPRKEA